MLKTLQNLGRTFSILTCGLIIACCILSSCKKDDKEDTPPPLPTLITVTTGSFAGNCTVLVTDSTGEVLAKSLIEPNDTLELKSEKPYDKDNINVFYHQIYLSGESYVTGYLKVKKGFALNLFHYIDNSSNKSVQVHIKNSTNVSFSKLKLITDVGSKEFTSLSDTANKMVLEFSPNRDMFVQVEKNGAMFCKFYPINQSTGVSIDICEINTPMAKKSIILPSNISSLSYYTLCKFDSKDERYYFGGLSAAQDYIIQNPYEFNYPPAGLFQLQNYFIMWREVNESYATKYNKGVPDKLEPLKLSCDVVNSKPSQFKAIFNGDFDFYLAYFYHGNNRIQLSVPSRVNEFKLPDFGLIFNDPNLNMSAFELKQITGLNVLEFPSEEFLDNYIKSENPVTDIYDTQYKYFSFPINN